MSTGYSIDMSTTNTDSATVGRANASKRKRRASGTSNNGATTKDTIARKKGKYGKGKQNTGKVAILIEMPLDILFEVTIPL